MTDGKRNREQFILDVWNLLKEQGHGSYDDTEAGCAYRSSDGSKCAVGMFLTDELYDLKCEGRKASDLVRFRPDIKEHFSFLELSTNSDMPRKDVGEFLNDIQFCHDRATLDSMGSVNASDLFLNRLKNNLLQLCKADGLTVAFED